MLLKDVESSGMQAKRDGLCCRVSWSRPCKLTSQLFKAAREGAWEEVEGGVQLNLDPAVVLTEGQYTLTTQVVSRKARWQPCCRPVPSSRWTPFWMPS